MATETGRVETFNTHLMKDEVVRALATGRDDEVADIMDAIRQAAARPAQAPPALITYGERGSGKSFLMRMVQLACAEVAGIACVLLPEEQYNIRTPQKILQVVASQVKGQPWTEAAWAFDARSDEDAWSEDLAALHQALDERFGPGQGMAVVLLENLDLLFLKLFGATAPAPGAASPGAQARRLAEERLRKLMSAPGGRFMLVASATGTVDMDYERPLFLAFRPIDLQPWDARTAIRYYNKRRELQALPALSPSEQARAEAVTEFVGGNARLTQLLGTALSTPDVRDIAHIFDDLVDQLADYYRQRLDALPPAAAGVLDAMIRGGEPVTQSALAQRVGATQPQIADAFSYLARSRLVQASTLRKAGGAQLFRVRDRLFVHFYRRRYGQASALAAIAELLERVLTPAERELEIRRRLLAGDFGDVRAFGRLPLSPHVSATGYCVYRDDGISDGPDHIAFALAGASPAQTPALRRAMLEQPDRAYRDWYEHAQRATQPLEQAAASVLASVAASRNGHDRMAEHELDAAVARARASGDADAQIVALRASAQLAWHRLGERDGGPAKALPLHDAVSELEARARDPVVRIAALKDAAFMAYRHKDYRRGVELAEMGLKLEPPPVLQMGLLAVLAFCVREVSGFDAALATANQWLDVARRHHSRDDEIRALWFRGGLFDRQERRDEELAEYRAALQVAESLDDPARQAELHGVIAQTLRQLGDTAAARAAGERAKALALTIEPPALATAAQATLLIANAWLDEDPAAHAPEAARLLLEAIQQGLEAGDGGLADDALDQLIYAASRAHAPDALDALAQVLERRPAFGPERDGWRVPDNWPWAVAMANAWTQALALAQRHPQLLARTPAASWNAAFRRAADPWVDAARQHGRAAAYALAGEALPAMQALWALRAGTGQDDPAAAFAAEPGWLIQTLTARCRDPGLLRDLADLFDTVCGPSIADQTSLLRAFADLHAAPDPQDHLLQVDPDLATVMRRVCGFPEPAGDALDKRGRRRIR